ncbi:MAG: NACHT domain-containing protein [Phormidium sp.]
MTTTQPVNQPVTGMSKRSLTISATGRRAAMTRLQGRNLSQRAFAKELEIAYSTVNHFFNGIPVDRRIFSEICEALGLEWEDVAQMPDEVDLSELLDDEETDSPDDLVETLQRNSNRARTALHPYLLQPIRRDALERRCMDQIYQGLRQGKRRIVPILGAAGYGKSTLLGMLYDRLLDEAQPQEWVALARCDDLIETAETFEEELGQRLGDRRQPVTEVVERLNGSGVLLLDTLDLILSPALVPVFRQALARWLERGVTVVFTCRDRDYRDFFEPYHESFAGVRDAVCGGCRVPEFTELEVRLAVRSFLETQAGYEPLERREAFAENLLALSADRASLREIVSNPLMLALCCDLFADLGRVPEDLTVSQLYETYWTWRIARSRHHEPQLGRLKVKLCLSLAGQLYRQSRDRLRDFLYDTDLELEETRENAYRALRSDGVLKDIGNGRIAFFHQTFLEYAIARWLTQTAEGEGEKQGAIARIAAQDRLPYYLWTIFRQLLVLVSFGEFQRLSALLPRAELLSFRALALAAIARQEPETSSVLASLSDWAKTQDGTYRETLLVVANSAPVERAEVAWRLVLSVLENVETAFANKAVELCSFWWLRLGEQQGEQLDRLFCAIQTQFQDNENARLNLFGQFLSAFVMGVRQQGYGRLDDESLAVLRRWYFEVGSSGRSRVWELYALPETPDTARVAFMVMATAQPPSNSFEEREAALNLFILTFPALFQQGDTPFGSSWRDVLAAAIPERWMESVAGALGKASVADGARLQELLRLVLADRGNPRRAILALEYAIEFGGGEAVAAAMRQWNVADIQESRLSSVAGLLAQLTGCHAGVKLLMLVWIAPRLGDRPFELIPACDRLIGETRSLGDRWGQLLMGVLPTLPEKLLRRVLKKLEIVPEAVRPWLGQLELKEARLLRVKGDIASATLRDRALAEEGPEAGDEAALQRLLAACKDPSREVALTASWAVLAVAEQRGIALLSVASGLASPLVGVRQNLLAAAVEGLRAGDGTQEEVLELVRCVRDEERPEVYQVLFQLLETLVYQAQQRGETVALAVAEAVWEKVDRLVEIPALLNPVAGAAFLALHRLAMQEQSSWVLPLQVRTRRLFQRVDIKRKVDRTMMTGLLVQLGKYDPDFLRRLVVEDCLNSQSPLPAANQVALVVAVAKERGVSSELLDRLLDCPGTPDLVKARILRERGV